MVALVSTLRSLLLWALWGGLTVVWVSTLWAQSAEGHSVYAVLAVVALALLFILYFAEGLELAATDLLDKDLEQIKSTSIRGVLKEIQKRSEFFYAQRQVFVVTIISFTSLITSYSWIFIPGIGKTSAYNAPFWFSLVFTTLTVLWFCQVTPKRLAIINSERFLAQSKFVWKLIKAISVLGLPNPSDFLVDQGKKRLGYGEKRHLLPSRATYYSLATQLNGFSLHSFSTEIEQAENGSSAIVKKYLVLLLHGAYGELYGSLEIRSTFAANPKIALLGLYTAPIPERFDLIAEQLGVIFAGDSPQGQSGFSANRLGEWAHKVDIEIHSTIEGQRLVWTIEGQRLPERFWQDQADSSPHTSPLVALLYQVEADVDACAFSSSEDEDGHCWSETIDLPCASYSITVTPKLGSSLAIVTTGFKAALVGTGAELSEETTKYARKWLAGGGTLEIQFPSQGAAYTTSWKTLPTK